MSRRKHVWIGIAVLLCFLMSVSMVSAETICEGDVTAQDVVSGSWDYYDAAYNWRSTSNSFLIKYDYAKQPEEMRFNAFDVQVIKLAGVRWTYDDGCPSCDIIPDSLIEVCTLKHNRKVGGTWYSEDVGGATLTIQKIGSCDGTPDCTYGQVNMLFDMAVTNTTPFSLPGTYKHLSFSIESGGTIDVIYSTFLGNDYTTAEDQMYTQQGFFVCCVIDGAGNMKGLLGGKAAVTGDVCPHSDGWSLTSYYNFKNYYEVNTNPTTVTVDVQRGGDDLDEYAVKSKLRIYDQYGLVLTESAWHTTNQTYTLPDVPQYMFLVPDFGDKSTELFICNYQSQDTAKIYGTVYNAENESTITGARVQIDAHHSTYSDSSGFYLTRTDYGSNHIITASKDGYWDWQETIYFDYAGDYEIDIPLIPKPPTHTGHGIYGIVRTLPYYPPVANQLVSIENATWSDTYTTNSVGYYYFDDLEVGNYWINVSKVGYRDNNQSVMVSATGDEIVTIDNCDAATNWSSDNSLTLNTTDKQEGTGSLQANGSSTMDFNKSAPSAVDASNVTKENGYMVFWYKINDTTRITDYLGFAVGSNGDNSTHKISWSVFKSNFVNDTWEEIWLKFSDGTETGTLNTSNINWLEVKAAKSDTVISKIDNIRFYDFSYEIHHVDLDPILSLGVIAKTTNEEVIASFTAILDGDSLNTTSGEELVFNNLSYGMKELTVTSEGYFPYQSSIYLDSNTNITAYMQEGAEGGAGVYYPPPHLVEFRVQNMWGKAYSNALVTASGYTTTMGTWEWLKSKFGFDNSSEIVNTTMSDTTDSNGHLTFLMVETVKYRINVSDTESPTRFDDKTFWIYPKDERYNLVVSNGITWQKAGTKEQKEMSINVTTVIINTSAAFLNVSYNDPSNQTTDLTIYVNQTINNNEEECLNSSNWVDTSVQNYSYIVTPYKGRAYKIQVVTEHEEWGSRTWTYAKRFEGMLIDLNLPDSAYPMIAVAVLLFTAGIWGRSSATQGAFVMCLEGWIFYAIGFLTMIPNSIIIPAISLATVVSIIALMTEKGRREGVQ